MNDTRGIMDLDERISMGGIKERLKGAPGMYPRVYTTYLADRLPDDLSPREFFSIGNQIVREISDGVSSNPTKPVPIFLYSWAEIQGSSLITDFGVGLSKDYCPPEFARAVRELHRQKYGE